MSLVHLLERRQCCPSDRRRRRGTDISYLPELGAEFVKKLISGCYVAHCFFDAVVFGRLLGAVSLYVDFNWVDHGVLRLCCIGFRGIHRHLQFTKVHILANARTLHALNAIASKCSSLTTLPLLRGCASLRTIIGVWLTARGCTKLLALQMS